MKKGVLIFSSVLFILPLLFVLSVEIKAQEVEEKIVVVKGTDDWKNTRIRLYPKDKVTIRATGKVCFDLATCNGSTVDADGWDWNNYPADWPDNFGYCFDPLRQVNHAALIGNVGSDDFFVGKNAAFTGKDGFLYLGINDCSLTGGPANSGQYEVFIKVTRIK
jgi:hypothetical protein